MTIEFGDHFKAIGVALNKTTDIKVMMYVSSRDIGLPKDEYGENPIVTKAYTEKFDNDGAEASLWTVLPFKPEILLNNGIKPGRYKHFKQDMPYEVIGIAFDLDEQKKMVLYSPQYDVPGLYDEYGHQPISTQLREKFFEDVERDGKKRQRFEYTG